MPSEFFERVSKDFRALQDYICLQLQNLESNPFLEDAWTYTKGYGGGRTRIFENGQLLEKGGVAYSSIGASSLPKSASMQLRIEEGTEFFATGVSLVFHPRNPFIPTMHMNIRFFEAGKEWWFGGGVDVTPYYPKLSMVIDYHRQLHQFCSEHGEDYLQLKKNCDHYFFLKHRNETRGIGGLFFDHFQRDKEDHLKFASGLGKLFPSLFKSFSDFGMPYSFSDSQREYQLIRRSRYVEFNLLYDRGTLFGLQSEGRVESILMSMPPQAKWVYNWQPQAESPEEKILDFYFKPCDWFQLDQSLEPASLLWK